jgi:hypothetical protein
MDFPVHTIVVPAVHPVKPLEIEGPCEARLVATGGVRYCIQRENMADLESAVRRDVAAGAILLDMNVAGPLHTDLRTLPGAKAKARKVEEVYPFQVWGHCPGSGYSLYSSNITDGEAHCAAVSAKNHRWDYIRILHLIFEDEAE